MTTYSLAISYAYKVHAITGGNSVIIPPSVDLLVDGEVEASIHLDDLVDAWKRYEDMLNDG